MVDNYQSLAPSFHNYREPWSMSKKSQSRVSDFNLDLNTVVTVVLITMFFSFFVFILPNLKSVAMTDSDPSMDIATVSILIQPEDTLEDLARAHPLEHGTYEQTLDWIVMKNNLNSYSMFPAGLPISVPAS